MVGLKWVSTCRTQSVGDFYRLHCWLGLRTLAKPRSFRSSSIPPPTVWRITPSTASCATLADIAGSAQVRGSCATTVTSFSDVFSPRDIDLLFQAFGLEQDLQMGNDLRRQIFPVFKEAVHNVIRHSGVTAVGIQLQLERGWFSVSVEDNGREFQIGADQEGTWVAQHASPVAKCGWRLEHSILRRGPVSAE